MPVNALSAGETYTEQQTLDDLNTENSISTAEEIATSEEVATDSNLSKDTSISDISSNDIEADALERMLSSEEKLNNEISLQSDNIEDEEEPSTDNWELGLVFYDSTVDNGKTPLTSIDWDASDGGYGEGTPRVITVQINYKNTNAVTTYQPGELEIKIPNLMYNQYETGRGSTTQLEWSAIVGANDSTHTGYDWNFKGMRGNTQYGSLGTYVQEMIFSNANVVEETSNFEGSIKIAYTLTPHTEYELVPSGGSSYTTYYPEKYEDECVHRLNINLQASLNDTIKSNETPFSYTRTYSHPWEKSPVNIIKSANKISSYDGLGENASDYIWVKYEFQLGSINDTYPQIGLYTNTALVYDIFPKECVLYNLNGEKLNPVNENGLYIIDNTCSSSNNYRIVYAGYPKFIFNEENDNLIITNTADYYGYYNSDLTKLEYLDTSSVTINLADFEFTYSGQLYKVEKWFDSFHESAPRYQDILKGADNSEYTYSIYNYANFYTYYNAIYTGTPMTVRFGDDLLYATNNDGGYSKLNDDEYYFSSISNTGALKNGNGNSIPKGKYDCELFVRYAGSTEYVSYEKFKNGYGGIKYTSSPDGFGTWQFTKDDKIVGWYINIYDVKESITYNKADWSSQMINTRVVFLKKEIPQSGRFYNFDYLQVYFKDKDGNMILQNEPNRDSYKSYITQEIADYDQETYGTYMQRGVSYAAWSYFKITQPQIRLYAIKSFKGTNSQDNENECFRGKCEIGTRISGVTSTKLYNYASNYLEQLDPEYALKGFYLYDLLPYGMDVISTKEEILETITPNDISSAYDLNGKRLTDNEIIEIIKNHTDVIVKRNWNNTGRTKLEIVSDFSDMSFYAESYTYDNSGRICTFTYEYEISYDDFLDYGNVYTNYVYVDKLKNNSTVTLYGTKDNGQYDVDASDINENGNTEETLSYAKATTTIESVVSTHQDVTKYVQTDKNDFSTGRVDSSCDSEYTYKLRVRTGENKVTNLVIYDSIEQYVQNPYSQSQDFITAYGKKKHWNGEFLGVDTSYAEKKGYKIKVWYSENVKAGNLSEDNSWKEYSDSVDKSKVKSLAFEYLNKDDESLRAVLPANSQTYVLIKMKSPADESITTLAYNGCRTEWNALDDYDRPVDFVTGINSNIVKVALPNSKDDDPIINLSFVKSIDGTEEAFEKLQLKKDNIYRFQIVLTNQDTGDIIKGILNSKTGLKINEIPIGTYLIKESDDMYFDFVDMTAGIADGIIFEKTDNGYLLTIDETISEDTTFEITVNNKIEPDKPYEDKKEKINLFKFFS